MFEKMVPCLILLPGFAPPAGPGWTSAMEIISPALIAGLAFILHFLHRLNYTHPDKKDQSK
jgi:hypothetical protein